VATFEVVIQKIQSVEHHPNADRLDLVSINDYRCIVGRDQYKENDLVAYIPEAAILPDWLIEQLGLTGRLAGKQKNRVKAVKLRGILSQGLIVPLLGDNNPNFPDACSHAIQNETETMGVIEGDDVTEFLGIVKYEPPIPIHMSGEVFNAFGYTLSYDIENIKKFPDVIKEGEEVTFTEKLHGTWCCFGHHPSVPSAIVSSKGISDKGLAFKFNKANENNLYIKALDSTKDENGLNVLCRVMETLGNDLAFYILGEVFGRGIQDLHYGLTSPTFRVFDVYIGEPGHGTYLNKDELKKFCEQYKIKRVPTLYRGPFSKDVMEEYTNGKETFSGKECNIREGIVINPKEERRDPEIGRVILKSVSEKYLLRKGNPTEFN